MELIGAGRSLLIYPEPDAKPHLWFVLTEPTGVPGKVVAVMVHSVKPHTDATVVLGPSEHPFIRWPTAVSYGRATFLTVTKIQRGFRKGTCHLLQDMSPSLLARVREGLLVSPRTPHSIRAYCERLF